MIDKKKRDKWDAHIINCKKYLERIGQKEERYKYHFESEISINDYLLELEKTIKDVCIEIEKMYEIEKDGTEDYKYINWNLRDIIKTLRRAISKEENHAE